ncbi:MAG: hypothetical protein RL662_960 [Bacteroidota bacterium]|jgi:hypothetical protein
MRQMQKYVYFLVFLLSVVNLDAQEISFRASAPSAVVKGESFRLLYTLSNGQGQNIQIPSTINGFEILYGPALSSSHSTRIVNGKASTNSSESYIYTLSATAQGTYNIPAATISVDGKSYTSNRLTIQVLPPDKSAHNQQNNPNNQTGQAQQQTSPSSSNAANIKASDAFIRAIVSKTRVREQEAFVVVFRFYTILDVKEIGKIEFPEFDGFMVEDEPLSSTRQLSFEHYNGRNYNVADLKRTLLFPQRSGQITIPSGKLEMVFRVRSGKTEDTFFGPQHVMTDLKKAMTTAPLTINVSELPAGKPSNFSNGVGSFSMTHQLSATDVKANDAITLVLKIAGTGNMKLIRTPELGLAKEFELYDPKIDNDLKFTDSGLSGTKTIEYMFIPRHQGTYKLAPIEIPYFDTRTNSYKTLTTPEYTIQVAKDPNAGNNTATSFAQTDVVVDRDIRYIKTGITEFEQVNDFTINNFSYYMWYIILTALFIACFVFYRKQVKQNTDVIGLRTKRANRMAVKRLKQAEAYIQANQKDKFYEELLRATWGYLSDKLAIPMAQLNRSNVELELARYGAGSQLATKFMSILDTCEFAQYAPSESSMAMNDLYQDTVTAIGEMENVKIKR